jgi:ABC-type enterochelin transport system substrate-binding protein
MYIYTLLYPQKVNFFDTLQLDNLDNLGVDESKVDAVAGSMLDKLFDV